MGSARVDRRTLFKVCGAALVLGDATACAARSGAGSGGRAWTPTNPVRIPPQLASRRTFDLDLRVGRTEFLAGKPAEVWGVNGSYLGPTLRMRRGDPVSVRVRNSLPETTTLHWHGMRLPATQDGGPHQPILPGATRQSDWRVVNGSSTTWYHPHPHGQTAMHVHRGVAGMIIIDDDPSVAAGLPGRYGVDDLPCVLQDRTIDDDGRSRWDTVPTFGQMGTDMLVNGTMNAYVDVTTTRVRLRLLNASNARLYNLGLADRRGFTLIANDAGLLPAPVMLDRVRLGPAERAEIVVELAPRQRVTLSTVAGDEGIDDGDFPIMELRAADTLTPSPELPSSLGGAAALVPAPGATSRRLRLQGHDAINGRSMDMMRIDEIVPADALEIWEIENNVYSHNFHIHGVEFTVLDRDGAPPAAYEAGRKDTVHVPEKSTVRLAVQFPPFVDPASPYMYHCHILRHEDDGMMGQFVVVEPGAEARTPLRLPA